MSDKFKVFFDYRKAQGKTRSATKRLAGGSDTNSVELGPWLEVESNQKMIYNMRGFYVVKLNSENVLIINFLDLFILEQLFLCKHFHPTLQS